MGGSALIWRLLSLMWRLALDRLLRDVQRNRVRLGLLILDDMDRQDTMPKIGAHLLRIDPNREGDRPAHLGLRPFDALTS